MKFNIIIEMLMCFSVFLGGIEAQRPDIRLSDLSNLLGTDWVNLAPHLGITDSDVNLIKSECPANAAQQARSMLRLWIHTHGNRASGEPNFFTSVWPQRWPFLTSKYLPSLFKFLVAVVATTAVFQLPKNR